MAGSGDPPDGTPDGTPEGLPGGGEDEYRSVVFDESFIRAAHIQELSAEERMGHDTDGVRRLPGPDSDSETAPDADPDPDADLDPDGDHGPDAGYEPGPGGAYGYGPRGGPRLGRRRGRARLRRSRTAALMVVLLVGMVFAAAIHLGSRYPYQPPPAQRAEPLSTILVALTPQDSVPGGRPADLYAHSPAAQYRAGAAGVTLPPARRTPHFSEGQVMAALTIAKDYLVQSSLDPDTLTGGTVRPVRLLLDPDQLDQFDRSVDSPAADGRHATGGWLIRFDPARVALADPSVRVQGTLRVAETSAEALEVTSDHTFAYTLRPAATAATAATATTADTADASLFTVRRELRFRFDREDLRMHRAELVAGRLQAGPMDCAADLSGALRPLLAGERPTTTAPPATDPYATAPAAATPLCATLPAVSQPTEAPGEPKS
ncbi:hypothetical protein [Streptomyces sp. TRM49041]|uniref:SCO2583 family membrane protein n=1 Tax=Streptomyces sp. TRM49041 TaxID=2603216 RepID=UPI0011EEC7D8|nr:hypothetical protein [Streptomyces sp. TRM49041]